MLILLKWEHINQELEVIYRRFAYHLNLIVNMETGNLSKNLRQAVETGLNAVTIGIVLTGRLSANLYRKINAFLETWHILVAGTELNVVANLRGNIDTNTGGTCGN